MIELNTKEDVKKYLAEEKIIFNYKQIEIIQLGGGVSSRVWKIISEDNRWVLKQALKKLKVQADWFSDVERIHREHEVMQAIQNIMPAGSVPEIVHADYTNHVYIMKSAEDEARTWKDILMHGNFDGEFAVRAGKILQCFHKTSDKLSENDKAKFQDQKYFIQLRVEPFHQHVIMQYPMLETYIRQLINEVTQKKICLVHGDFSPKNMLIESNNNFVLIDYEVTHWGNPVFDVAYCIAHLILKGWHLKRREEARQLIEAFLTAYNNSIENLMPHLGLMLLARMDGKSPVDYIKDEALKNIIRKEAITMIKSVTINFDDN
jgi:aminoglycoside phosphotransferase (APT) family kinase protein